VIALAAVPTYLAALARDVTSVDDVRTDPRTTELVAYCGTHGIGALLDIPIFFDGALAGVVCHERANPRRIRRRARRS
jgi:GAF domain-containing protein